MYPQAVVYIDQPNPPGFFICQKWTIVVLNAIPAAIIAFCLLLALFGALFTLSAVKVSCGGGKIVQVVPIIPFLSHFHFFQLLFFLFFSFLILGYFYCGIVGACQENERLFQVYLAVNILGTVLTIASAVYLLVAMSFFEGSSSSISTRRKWEGSFSFENDDAGGGGAFSYDGSFLREQKLKIISSVVGNIGWTAFLVVFACSLRRWNQQKADFNSQMMIGRRC